MCILQPSQDLRRKNISPEIQKHMRVVASKIWERTATQLPDNHLWFSVLLEHQSCWLRAYDIWQICSQAGHFFRGTVLSCPCRFHQSPSAILLSQLAHRVCAVSNQGKDSSLPNWPFFARRTNSKGVSLMHNIISGKEQWHQEMSCTSRLNFKMLKAIFSGSMKWLKTFVCLW